MLALSPKQTFVYTPAEDAELPPDQQRRLTVRFMSAAEMIEYADKFDAAKAVDDERQHLRDLSALIAGACEGVTAAEVLASFGSASLLYHAAQIAQQQHLQEIDAKKSAWRLPSTVANSAGAAAPADA